MRGDEKNPRNSFVLKILTSNPYAFKILQTVFDAEPASVKVFEGLGGRGVPANPARFPETKLPQPPVFRAHSHFFLKIFHRPRRVS
jgi:hypothetical protein